MKVIELDIGSDAWHEYRDCRIGASDSACILGISPWKTLKQLYDEKVNKIKQKSNFAMQRGLDREEEAREWFKYHTGITVEPAIVQHPVIHWKFATLDGISEDGNTIVEIKWANLKVHELAKQGQVIDYYYSQVQSQIECAHVEFGYFLSCHEKDGSVDFVLVKVMRDVPYIIDLTEKERDFYNDHLSKKIPPKPTEKDLSSHVPPIPDDKKISFDLMCEEYLRINEQIKNLTEIKEDIMNHLKSETGSCCSMSYSLKRSVVKGRIDYKEIFDFYKDVLPPHIEANPSYKKPDTESWRITKI